MTFSPILPFQVSFYILHDVATKKIKVFMGQISRLFLYDPQWNSHSRSMKSELQFEFHTWLVCSKSFLKYAKTNSTAENYKWSKKQVTLKMSDVTWKNSLLSVEIVKWMNEKISLDYVMDFILIVLYLNG